MIHIVKKGNAWTFKGSFHKWSKTGQPTFGVIYEALTLPEADGLARSLRAGFTEIALDPIGEGPAYRITATTTREEGADPAEQIVDTHELDGSDYLQPLLTSPVLQTLFTNPEGAISVIAQLVNDVKKGSKSRDDAVERIESMTAIPAEQVAATGYLDDLLAGHDSFIDSRFAYKQTFNVPDEVPFTLDYRNINCVFPSVSSLLSLENIELPANFTLPDGEWLKKTPKQVKQFGSGIQFMYEYWWATEWNRRAYFEAA